MLIALSLQSLGETLKEEVALLLGNDERWEDAKDIGACSASEDVLLVKEAVTNFLVRIFELNTNHKALAAELLETRNIHLLKAFHEVLTHLGSILHEVVLLNDIEDGASEGAAEVIATKGSAELTIDWLEHWRNEHACERIAVGNALSYGDDVWLNAIVLVCEELT